MNNNFLTVILITYNHVKYFEKCIESVLSQKTDFDFIIKVYDDASTDGTSDLVRKYAAKYPNKIKAYINNMNEGALNNILKAYKDIDTKYFATCETDDYWCDDLKLQKQVDALEQNPDCSFCGHNTIQYNVVDDTYTEPFYNIETKKIQKLTKKFKLKDFKKVHPSSRVYRTECIDLDSVKNKEVLTWDSTSWWYFLSKGNLYYIDEVMSVYNYTLEGVYSAASIKKQKQMAINCIMLINKEFNYKYNHLFLKLFENQISLTKIEHFMAKYILKNRKLENFYYNKSKLI